MYVGSSIFHLKIHHLVETYTTRNDSLSKTILKGTLEGGDAMVGKGNAGWTT